MRLLELKPQIRQNWTALAVAHHLQGDPARAEAILASFEETLKVRPHNKLLIGGCAQGR
jgi:N-alpha-acetyltransferase 15/16, NatA auxiliary subunit